MKCIPPFLTLVGLLMAAACTSGSDSRTTQSGASDVQATLSQAPKRMWEQASSLPSSLRAAYIRTVQRGASKAYQFRRLPQGASVAAHNAAQRLTAEVAEGALLVVPDSAEPDWTLALRWTGIGRGDCLDPVATPNSPVDLQDNLATYRRPGGSEEWYLNGPLGIEQGFVLPQPPAVDPEASTGEALTIELTVAGTLVPTERRPAEGSDLPHGDAMVALRTHSGETVLQYSNLYATDADGRPLDARLEVAGQRILLRIDDRTARYPLLVDPLLWFGDGQLTTANGELGDCFGVSMAVDGDTAIVGAPGELASGGTLLGAAHVFVRAGDSWSEQQTLTASDGEPGERFGVSVALEGDTAFIGAITTDVGSNSGAAYVFERTGTVWNEEQKLTASDSAGGSYFGIAVALDGTTAVVGAYRDDVGDDDTGAAYVFERSGTVWSEEQKLWASDGATEREFGFSVSLSGDSVLIGSPGALLSSVAGSAYVFVRSGGVWSEQQILVPAGSMETDFFGFSASLQGDTALVGAPSRLLAGAPGAAHVFERSGTVWAEQQLLTPSDSASADRFGSAATLSADLAMVGAAANDGAMYVFRNDGAVWAEEQKLSGSYDGQFGYASSVSGDTMLAGAVDFYTCSWSSVYVFALAPSNGTPCASGLDCGSGYCVDEVCCDAECGGGIPGDCWVCSVVAGSSSDGTCESLVGNSCDDGAYCTGTDLCSPTGCDDSSGDPCAANHGDDDMNCTESCNEDLDDCSAPDPDGMACAFGGECDSGRCILPGGAPCADDLECRSGYCVVDVCCVEPDCAPYRCGPTGACRTSCTSSSDCVPGYVCNWEARCAEPSETRIEQDCGCRLVGTTASSPPWAPWSLLALLLLRRRAATRRSFARCSS